MRWATGNRRRAEPPSFLFLVELALSILDRLWYLSFAILGCLLHASTITCHAWEPIFFAVVLDSILNHDLAPMATTASQLALERYAGSTDRLTTFCRRTSGRSVEIRRTAGGSGPVISSLRHLGDVKLDRFPQTLLSPRNLIASMASRA